MRPGNYRLRLARDAFHIFLVPSLVLKVVLGILHINPGNYAIFAYLAVIIPWAITKRLYIQYIRQREAQRLGSRMIPHVVGKWPGNLDILLDIIKAYKTGYMLNAHLQLFEKYQCTTLNLRIMWSDLIITMDQVHCHYVFATGFDHFWKGDLQKERLETFFGEATFNRDDEKWKMHRTNSRPFFARERISDFQLIERYSQKTLSIISSLSKSNQPCEIQDLLSRFSLDAGSDFLFGINLNTLAAQLPIPGKTNIGPRGSATDDSWGKFAKAFERAQQVVTNRTLRGYFWPLLELFKDKNIENAKVMREFMAPFVKSALQQRGRPRNADDSINFLQHLADTTDDPKIINDQLLGMLAAAKDTTAVTLSYVVYFMCMHPEVTQRMRAEVLANCGAEEPPTFEICRSLKYVRAVINETLRLYPALPVNAKETRQSPVILPLPDATFGQHERDEPLVYVPGGTPILIMPLLVQRNPVLWGDDADVFDPERWIDPKRLARYVANPTMFTPFSCGPRICLGQNYAYNQMTFFLVRLLQRFDHVTLAPECQPEESRPPKQWKSGKGRQAIEKVWPTVAMSLYIKGGMWVRFRQADG